MNDYSAYLDKNLPWIESQWLHITTGHYFIAHIINEAIKRYDVKSVIEIGCGSGEVAKLLNTNYIGYDANEKCLELARQKCRHTFIQSDIRTLEPVKSDLVVTSAVLKHFGLHEWSDIFQKISGMGEYFIFDMPITNVVKDDGSEFHHVWMTKERVYEECERVGLEILQETPINKDEVCFITKHK